MSTSAMCCRRGVTRIELLVMLTIAVLLGSWLVHAVQHAREAARISACIGGNSKAFTLALHNYHDMYEMFPPTYFSDADGPPLYSWRIALLPYLELREAHDSFDHSGSWDVAANRQLIDSLKAYPYKCPSAPPENATMTDFVAIAGTDTTWQHDGTAIRFEDITDGSSNTIHFVEVNCSGIHRAEPRDFHTLQMSLQINPTSGQGISSPHEGFAFAAFCDGTIKALRNGMSKKVVRAMITRNGAETVKPREEGRSLY